MSLHINVTHSAGGIVMNGANKVVLICENGNFWGFPKGRIEKDEEALTAAIREIKEESGITNLKLVRPIGEFERHPFTLDNKEDVSELKLIQMFLFRTDQSDLSPLESNAQAAWLSIDEASNKLTHPADKQYFLSIKDLIIPKV